MLLGGMCNNCQDNRMQVLELDHVHDNGVEERKIFNQYEMIGEVFKRPSDFQLLCGSCHNLKTKGFLDFDNNFKQNL